MKNLHKGIKPTFIGFIAVLLTTVGFSMFYLMGCSAQKNNPTSPVRSNSTMSYAPSGTNVSQAITVQNQHAKDLMKNPDVVGVGTGLDNSGNPAIIVFTRSKEHLSAEGKSIASLGLPSSISNVPVVIDAAGKFHAFKKGGGHSKGGSNTGLTGKYDPVPNGASIINPVEGCASGTLGCLVTDGTHVYVLSCNHVLANENNASLGGPIFQPGTYDAIPQCSTTYSNTIADLSAFAPIDFSGGNNTIDAAIAQVTDNPPCVGATTAGYYGFPSSTIATATVNMKIQKVGRTTSLTTGTVTAVNATVTVQYSSTETATFVGQIITSRHFSKAGDSGSLVVTNDSNKYPVGLLFAGTNSGVTILNPIGEVLNYFNVTVVSQ